jgi:hypothetical protein
MFSETYQERFLLTNLALAGKAQELAQAITKLQEKGEREELFQEKVKSAFICAVKNNHVECMDLLASFQGKEAFEFALDEAVRCLSFNALDRLLTFVSSYNGKVIFDILFQEQKAVPWDSRKFGEHLKPLLYIISEFYPKVGEKLFAHLSQDIEFAYKGILKLINKDHQWDVAGTLYLLLRYCLKMERKGLSSSIYQMKSVSAIYWETVSQYIRPPYFHFRIWEALCDPAFASIGNDRNIHNFTEITAKLETIEKESSQTSFFQSSREQLIETPLSRKNFRSFFELDKNFENDDDRQNTIRMTHAFEFALTEEKNYLAAKTILKEKGYWVTIPNWMFSHSLTTSLFLFKAGVPFPSDESGTYTFLKEVKWIVQKELQQSMKRAFFLFPISSEKSPLCQSHPLFLSVVQNLQSMDKFFY